MQLPNAAYDEQAFLNFIKARTLCGTSIERNFPGESFTLSVRRVWQWCAVTCPIGMSVIVARRRRTSIEAPEWVPSGNRKAIFFCRHGTKYIRNVYLKLKDIYELCSFVHVCRERRCVYVCINSIFCCSIVVVFPISEVTLDKRSTSASHTIRILETTSLVRKLIFII